MARKIREERQANQIGGTNDEMDTEAILDLEEIKGDLKEWLKEPKTIQFIRNAFNKFLRNYKDNERRTTEVYEERINEMCHNNLQSLEVTYNHITKVMPTLAIWIAEAPAEVLPIFNQVAYELVLEVFPQYENIHSKVFVRIKDLPI